MTRQKFSLIAATAMGLLASPAWAAASFPIGSDGSFSIGAGVRTDFTAAEDGAPDGKSTSTEFSLDSIRLYLNFSLNKQIAATFNTERDSSGHINVLDAYLRYEPADAINVWVGRMLPPSDRANLDGPYYLNTWLYPGVVSQYPAKFDGRDDGATVWGKLLAKKLVYAVGAFQGHNDFSEASDQGGHLLYAGRVAYNFLDAEDDPAYYTSSTYYGAQKILTLAFAGMYEKSGVGSALKPGDYASWNSDLLYEVPMQGLGTPTLEAAYYHYNTGGVTDVSGSFNGATSTDNVGGLAQGSAFLVGGAFLFPQEIGWGKFQPAVRYQQFDNSITHEQTHAFDAGVNYVIKGHNLRLSADYQRGGVTRDDTNEFVIGAQAQF